MKRRKGRSPLRGKAKSLASKFIAEEVHTDQYPRKQAIAIGISRARSKIKDDRQQQELRRLCLKYGVKA
jgi:hypothetical protein